MFFVAYYTCIIYLISIEKCENRIIFFVFENKNFLFFVQNSIGFNVFDIVIITKWIFIKKN